MLRQGLIFAAFLLLSQQATAAAFALKEQGASYLGTAFSGTASAAIDANTSFYNPAGLATLPNNQITLSGCYIAGHMKLYNGFARDNAGAVVTNSSPVARPKSNAFIPGVAASRRYNQRLVFGLTVGSPFGLSTEYATQDIARYMATESKIETIDISPAFGYRLNRCWYLGAGFDAMYTKAIVNSAYNDGSGEGFVKNKGDGWVFGYHLGLMFVPADGVNMGLAYFSRFNPRVSGTVQVAATPPPPPSTLSGQVNLPDSITYGVTYKYSDTWTGMGQIDFTHWSRFKTLVINYNTGRFAQENLYYKNAWRFAFGVDYKCNQQVNFKGGFAFDQTPVTNTYRSARLPDSDRYWFTLGARYQPYRCVAVDIAYAYVYFVGCAINQRGGGTDTLKFLSGNYRNSSNIVGMQLTWNFV